MYARALHLTGNHISKKENPLWDLKVPFKCDKSDSITTLKDQEVDFECKRDFRNAMYRGQPDAWGLRTLLNQEIVR